MKTVLVTASLFVIGSMFACAAPAEQQEPPVVVEAAEAKPQMINQGGCTPEQLAMGAWEVDGECYSGGGAGGGGVGGGGGGGGTSIRCHDRCMTTEAACERRCETSTSMSRCLNLCYAAEARCDLNCG
jgi:hypothetical protein